MSDLHEASLRGPVEGIDPYLMPAAHVFVQVREGVEKAAVALGADERWRRPGGEASVGFHLRHITVATVRLSTYARGEKLSHAQVERAKSEQWLPAEGEARRALRE